MCLALRDVQRKLHPDAEWHESLIDVPEGKRTDFYRGVKAEPGENVVFSWLTRPDRGRIA